MNPEDSEPRRTMEPAREASIGPFLSVSNYRVTSEETDAYNCAAWAMQIENKRWWPNARRKGYYWPNSEARGTVADFMEFFSQLGFSECDNYSLETGYEKLALYSKGDGVVDHMARQLHSGRWTSKCGNWEDIEHDLESIQGLIYGKAIICLKRARVDA